MWENVDKARPESAHYSAMRKASGVEGMDALREMFPDAEANELNFVLFSTSGVHGTYNTIEAAERCLKGEDDEGCAEVTFVIVHPRLVAMRYGVCNPANQEDIDYLKRLRESSHKAAAGIGATEERETMQTSFDYRHKKTGNLYVMLSQAVDCTNVRDGTPVVVYAPKGDMARVYVRDEAEFSEKFELVEAVRGSHIKATMRHGAGAYARCGWCGRYSDKIEALNKDEWPCECGKLHGWSGSFVAPTAEAKWSDATHNAEVTSARAK